MRRTSLASSDNLSEYLRVTLVGFLRRRWLLIRFRRISFPEPVTWIRALAPLWVLSFGIG